MLMIDGRAGSVRLIPLLPPDLVKRHKLEGGDVAFFGYGPEGPYTLPIGIEYKTAQEALQCMLDGRLVNEQLPKMSDIYKRVYILIEGIYREDVEGIVEFQSWKDSKPVWRSYAKVQYRSFENWMNSVAEVGRIVIKRSLDINESVAMILSLYYFWAKDYDKHLSVFKLSKDQEPTLLSKPTTKRLIAASIPGVGHELSGRVASHFRNVVEMVNAGVDEWIAIPGIGKTKATKIYNCLRAS